MESSTAKKNIARYVKGLMRRFVLNQADLAEILGIPQGKLSKIKNEKELTNVIVLNKMAQLGKHSIEDIINGNFDYDNVSETSNGNSETINIVGSKVINSPIVKNGSVNIYSNSKVLKRNNYVPQQGDITLEQASNLKKLVDEIVELEEKVKQKPKSYAAVWSALNRKMKVTYYREIKAKDYNAAEIYLRKWAGRLKRQKKFSRDYNDDYRKSRITAIFTIGKKHLNFTDEDIRDMIFEFFNKESIKELTDDELEQLYTRFNSWKRRSK